ncbi:MAG: substrate-binding domain-containing protein [Clostridia bacterium]|nr:substrate-binding domain-containing protein [Clostridia bacterium]
MKRKVVLKNIGKLLAAIVAAAGIFIAAVLISLTLSFGNVHGGRYAIFVFLIGLLTELIIIGALWGFIKKRGFYIPVLSLLCLSLIACAAMAGYQKYIDSIPTVGDGGDLLLSYAPYAPDSKAVTLDEESELRFEENLPVMDGATALYPIYSAFAKAVYPKEMIDNIAVKQGNVMQLNYNDYLKCTTTTGAYENIVTGDADIIFAALPSDEQKKFAEDSGVELQFTPIGKEAFVFFVNAKNPISDITVSDIQNIYSGKITKWEELGVKGFGEIRAFQRDEGSGSQSTLQKLMEGRELMTPPEEDVIDGMGGIIKQTADYKNYKNAIGYSFRFYSTEMVKNNQIKLLSVNGVYPELKSIENGTYPLASYFYAVTRSDAGENVKKLLEWIKGSQGQKIIEMTGYTPVES